GADQCNGMPDHAPGQVMDVSDVRKRLKQFGDVLAGQHDVDIGVREKPLDFGHQGCEQQQVSEPMVGAANEDPMDVASGKVPWLRQVRVAGADQQTHRPTDDASPQLAVPVTFEYAFQATHGVSREFIASIRFGPCAGGALPEARTFETEDQTVVDAGGEPHSL